MSTLAVQFALNYQHQPLITYEIAAKLESSLREALAGAGLTVIANTTIRSRHPISALN
jgi:hypothetical protein